jgi:hypothetical protein
MKLNNKIFFDGSMICYLCEEVLRNRHKKEWQKMAQFSRRLLAKEKVFEKLLKSKDIKITVIPKVIITSIPKEKPE